METTAVKKRRAYHLILVGHVIFIAGWLTSPFWLPWPWLLALTIVLFLQNKYLGYCVITKWQFGTKEVSFWVYYLKKFGLSVERKKVGEWTRKFFVISMATAILWQTVMW